MIKCEKLWRLFDVKIVRFGNGFRARLEGNAPPEAPAAGFVQVQGRKVGRSGAVGVPRGGKMGAGGGENAFS